MITNPSTVNDREFASCEGQISKTGKLLCFCFVLQDITSKASAADLSYTEAILPTTNVSNNKLHGTNCYSPSKLNVSHQFFVFWALTIYINKNVTVRLVLIENLRK
jgi:hypothetical protein